MALRRHRSRLEIKSDDDFRRMRRAGLVVARALGAMREAAVAGTSTLELDRIARGVLSDAGATSNFLGYDIGSGPFPGVICASVNDRVVHGIPSSGTVLDDGDLLSIDFGAVIDGWHADAAISVPIGEVSAEVSALCDVTEQALWAGLAAVHAGVRVGDISNAVQTSVRRAERTAGRAFGIVEGYGGHGIGTAMHMDPHILNYGEAGRGVELPAGTAVAIEPMLTLGGPDTAELDDGWTIVTTDGSWAAHWEHTIAITADGVCVTTALDGGAQRLGALGVPVAPLD